jgi:hypothetical protein
MILWSLVLALSCQQAEHSGLASYPDVRVVFSETEIGDLNTILNFFEHQICDLLQVQSADVRDCYQALFQMMERAEKTRILYVPVPFDAQKEMYSHLSATTFKEIWIRGTGVESATGDTLERIHLNFDGKYTQFLDSLKTDHRIIESYVATLKRELTINSTMIEGVMFNYRLYDMNDLRMRLFIAVHYLTINDMYERRNAG